MAIIVGILFFILGFYFIGILFEGNPTAWIVLLAVICYSIYAGSKTKREQIKKARIGSQFQQLYEKRIFNILKDLKLPELTNWEKVYVNYKINELSLSKWLNYFIVFNDFVYMYPTLNEVDMIAQNLLDLESIINRYEIFKLNFQQVEYFSLLSEETIISFFEDGVRKRLIFEKKFFEILNDLHPELEENVVKGIKQSYLISKAIKKDDNDTEEVTLKLNKLKEVYDLGLFTEEEYRNKRAAIINSL